MPTEKRRTTTSTAVKQRYLDKTYTQFNCRLRNEDAAEILEFIESTGWSKAEFIKNAFDALTRQKMTVFYTYPPATVFVNIIVEIDGIAWDFTEGFPGIEYYEGRQEDRKTDLIHLIQRWIEADALRTAFHNAPDDEKYPASEIFTRFPDAVKL